MCGGCENYILASSSMTIMAMKNTIATCTHVRNTGF